MKIVLVLLLSIVTFAAAQAQDAQINKKQLFGRWQVVKIDSKNINTDEEVWDFKRNNVRIILSGSADSPVTYEIVNNTIIVDSMRMPITKYTGNSMVVDSFGSIYLLERESKN